MSSQQPPLPASFPLPAVHKDLGTYILPPSSASHVRSLLTSHLAALSTQPRITAASGSTDEFHRFLEHELSRTGDGVRKRYLTSLRENVIAKKEHTAAVAALQAAEEEWTSSDEEGDAGWREDYLHTLRLRRQTARLAVLREGVAVLAAAGGIEKPREGLLGAYRRPPPEMPEELMSAGRKVAGGEVPGEGDGGKDLVLELQKRVVAAAEELAEERGRVAELRERGGGSAGRIEALRRVQAELLAWLERALEIPAPPPPPPQEELGNGEKKKKTTEDMLAAIDAAYTAYLASRKELLELMREAAMAKATPLPSEDVERAEETRRLLTHRLDVDPPLPDPNVLRVLAGCEHLLPLVRTQKALLAVHNNHSASLARRQASLAAVFLGKEDVVEAARERGSATARALTQAEAGAEKQVAAAVERLKMARATAIEVDALCKGGDKRKVKPKRAIPVRRGGREVAVEEEAPRGVWGGLGGGVGVIGDGI